jgi:hypothetical protein
MKIKLVCIAILFALLFPTGVFANEGELMIEMEIEKSQKFVEEIDLDSDDNFEEIEIEKTFGSAGVLSVKVEGFYKEFYKGIYGIDENGFWIAYPLYNDDYFSNAFYDRAEKVYVLKNDDKIELSEPVEYELPKLMTKGVEDTKYYENPDKAIIENKIEKAAKNRGIPSVILKSIAYAESNWLQFRNGKPVISFDGGYGIMQVTPSQSQIDSGYYDVERLKYDIDYNIEKGADILLGKWGYALGSRPVIPRIGKNDPNILESWYFTIWAYNGWSRVNNPNDEASWTKPYAYQDRVIYFAETRFDTEITEIDKLELPKSGLPSASRTFDLPDEIHYGDLNDYEWGQVLICRNGLNLRDKDDNWKVIGGVSVGTPMYVLEGPYLQNGYNRYKVLFYDSEYKKEGWVAVNWGDVLIDKNPNLSSYERIEFQTKDVNEEKVWVIKFNEEIDVSSLDGNINVVRVDDESEKVKDIIRVIPSIKKGSKEMELEHDELFSERGRYYILLNSKLKDIKGRNLSKDFKYEFEIK